MFPLSFDNNRFLVFWRFDDQKDSIFIHLRVKTTGWIGFGFAETEARNMMNYDVIVGGYSNGQGYLNVRFTHTSSDIDKYLNLLHLHFTRSLSFQKPSPTHPRACAKVALFHKKKGSYKAA